MLSQEQYDLIRREGGCVFETRGKVCRAAVALGKKYCPRHQALLDAQSERNATRPKLTRQERAERDLGTGVTHL